MKTIDITPLNNKNQKHGYWERYYLNGDLQYKGYFINDNCNGYWEHYEMFKPDIIKYIISYD